MGQKVHPFGFRLGYNKNWQSRWFSKKEYPAFVYEWAKGVASPIVGATRACYLDDAAGALDVQLTAEDIALLEANYVPHPIVGAIDANPPQGVMLLDEKK